MNDKITGSMRKLKLGGLVNDWQSIKHTTKDQYVLDLLELEIRECEVYRINSLVKQTGFTVIKTLDNF